MWKYGDAGDKYPVKAGDIWAVGGHRLACGDLSANDHTMVLTICADTVPTLVYSDPPWNAGNARSFRTKAGVDVGPLNFGEFLTRFMDLLRAVNRPFFIEMGGQSLLGLHDAIRAAGGHVRQTWGITYYRTHPCYLVAGDFGTPLDVGDADPSGMDDDYTPGWAASVAEPGAVIFDPCIGRGHTAVAAHKAGHRCLGVELHPRRLAVTIQKLHALGAGEPRKIGTIKGGLADV